MNNYKCPICEKAGLEDFRNKEIVCPACNSDLSIFVTINNNVKNSNKYIFILIACLCVATATTLIFYSSSSTRIELKELKSQLVKNEQIIIQLNDSINNIQQPKQIVENVYTVTKGDSFCKISSRLFGSEKYAKKIAELNNKGINSKIFPGSKLKIPQR